MRRRARRKAAAPLPSGGGRPPRALPRKRWALALLAAIGGLIAALAHWPEDVAAIAGAAPAAPARPGQAFLSAGVVPAAAPAAAPREQQRQLLANRVEMADETLCAYREKTKYPNASRPISEHPDQVHPNRPVEETRPLRREEGGSDDSVQVQTTQSRVWLAAGEAATFSVRAFDRDGTPLPVVVTGATAQGLAARNERSLPPQAIPFADDGRNGDGAAGDLAYTGRLAPAQGSYAQFAGTIRTVVRFTAGGRNGMAVFDVIHTPELPATWAGPVREAVEDGSLVFVLPADVRMPGRYIVTGRIDDAQGKPFALATFNDLLPQGRAEIRLTAFGKLLLDAKPALPLRLRDVEAYLLKENVDPDRALMPRLEGPLFQSKTQTLRGMSGEEWQGEERSRHLAEFGRDLERARNALLAFDPAQRDKPMPRGECSRRAELAGGAAG